MIPTRHTHPLLYYFHFHLPFNPLFSYLQLQPPSLSLPHCSTSNTRLYCTPSPSHICLASTVSKPDSLLEPVLSPCPPGSVGERRWNRQQSQQSHRRLIACVLGSGTRGNSPTLCSTSSYSAKLSRSTTTSTSRYALF